MKELIDKFDKLKAEFHNHKTTEEQRVELFKQMKSCLLEINDNQDQYEFHTFFIADKTKFISKCTNPSELYEILGDIRASLSSDRLTEIAEQERERQTNLNKYGKDNPYPHIH